jgi:hypothetical protein
MGTELQALTSEIVVTEYLVLTRQFGTALGVPGGRRSADAATFAALEARIAALTQQARLLREELATVHRGAQANSDTDGEQP